MSLMSLIENYSDSEEESNTKKIINAQLEVGQKNNGSDIDDQDDTDADNDEDFFGVFEVFNDNSDFHLEKSPILPEENLLADVALTTEESSRNVDQEFILEPDSELRIEVGPKDKDVKITLKNGHGEIFGAEMSINKTYALNAGAKIAVFTWHGCLLEVSGRPITCYISTETPMVMYLNCHAAIEQLRRKADLANVRGPIIMVVGPPDVGKSTLCRILCNYAFRSGRTPLYIDLDVVQGDIYIPGVIGKVLIDYLITIEDHYSEEPPFLLHYGSSTPSDNVALYNTLMLKLQNYLRQYLEKNQLARNSGVIINTCGWIKTEGYRSIIHAAKTFEVDAIIVLDEERLHNELVRDVPDFVKIVFLPKSCGVVERDFNQREELRQNGFRDYFYGSKNTFNPYCFDLKFSSVKILQYLSPSDQTRSFSLSISHNDSLAVKVVVVEPNSKTLLHRILAISSAMSLNDEIIGAHVYGFLSVSNVDESEGVFTVLSLVPAPLPNNILLLSNIEFINDH